MEKNKLYKHQLTALNYLRINNSFMLCMEQGTGKTFPSLCRILELAKSGLIKNALVVCPKSVIASWERDIGFFTTDEQEILNNILTIINYDKVWRGKAYAGPYDLILLDEAHSIANRSSRRGDYLLKLSVKAKYRYLLTGTPIGNGRLEDTYSLICFLKPYMAGTRVYSSIYKELTGGRGSYYDWCNRYALLDQYYKPYKYLKVNEIQSLLAKYSYVIKKAECLDLPAKLPDEIRTLELLEPKLYKEMAKDSVIADRELIADNPLTRLLYLRNIASGHLLEDKLKTSKTEALNDLLDELGPKKLVIFYEFTASSKDIEQVLQKRDITYYVLNGKTKDKDIWRKYQADNTQVMLAQYQAGYQGIDLYSADTTLYYEPTLRSQILEQSRDRTHRNGQKRACSYIHFITKGTVEVAIYRALSNFQDFNKKLFTEELNSYARTYRRNK